MSSSPSSARAAQISFRLFVLGVVFVVIGMVSGYVALSRDSGHHGAGALILIMCILVGTFAAGIAWLVSLGFGLAAVREHRYVLWWVVPELLVLGRYVIIVMFAR